ncbi:MAG: hypothetical protein ACE5HI_09525 [bacterium]
MKLLFVSAILLLIISTSYQKSVAGEDAYKCKVNHIYNLTTEGSLMISNWEKQFRGSEFFVSRITGEITGKVVPTLLANSTKVINKGNESWSFRAISEFDAVNKPFSSKKEDTATAASIQLLEIQEFRNGDRKPFVAMSMGGAGIVTGMCE